MDSGIFTGRKEGVFKRQLEARRLTASPRRAAAARRHKPRDVTMGDPAIQMPLSSPIATTSALASAEHGTRSRTSPRRFFSARAGMLAPKPSAAVDAAAAPRRASPAPAPLRHARRRPHPRPSGDPRASGDGSVENIARARGEVALDGLLGLA